MGKEFRLKLEKVFDFLGELLAFLTISIWAVHIININFPFLPVTVAAIIDFALKWALLALVAVEGFECTIKRNILIRLVFYILLAIVIVFECFPEAYNSVISHVPGAIITSTTTGMPVLPMIL